MRWAVVLLAITLSGCFDGKSTPKPDDVAEPAFDLSPVRFDTILREQSTVLSSIDGSALVVDVFRPDTDEPAPIILVQSPYWSNPVTGGAPDWDRKNAASPTWYIDYFVPRGYAVALGEMRGTRSSGGCWDFGGNLDQQDGHDMVEHLAAMPWSNGNVGMLGQSHVGMSQVAAAVTAPPSLKTIVPIAAVTDWYRYLHKDGAPYVVNRATPPAYFAVHASPTPSPGSGENAAVDWVLNLAATACADNVVHLSQSAELDGDKDAYWQERDLIAKAGNTRAAVFLVHGFLDENVKTDHFLDYWQALPDDIPKKAWFGQWFHEHPSYHEWRDDLHRWYDHFLLGIENGITTEPVVTVQDNLRFNRTEANWPTGAAARALDLGPGTLGPPSDADTQNYLSLPGDDRAAVPRSDPSYGHHLAFATDPLETPWHITGAATLNLTVGLATPSARLIAALFDVAPDGSRDEITRSYMDAAHRNGPETNEIAPLLDAVEYHLTFYPRDHRVAAGHVLELVLFGGDTGCIVGTALDGPYARTCEGTGIVPLSYPTIPVVDIGAGQSTLWLPLVHTPGPERTLTPLDDWLDDVPA